MWSPTSWWAERGWPAATHRWEPYSPARPREDLVRRAADLGARLRKALEPLEDHPNVAQVRGLGLLQAVELVRDRETLEPFPAEVGMAMRVVVQGIVRGAFFYPGGCGPARDVVCLGPPFIIGDEELELIARILPEAIDAAVASADR